VSARLSALAGGCCACRLTCGQPSRERQAQRASRRHTAHVLGGVAARLTFRRPAAGCRANRARPRGRRAGWARSRDEPSRGIGHSLRQHHPGFEQPCSQEPDLVSNRGIPRDKPDAYFRAVDARFHTRHVLKADPALLPGAPAAREATTGKPTARHHIDDRHRRATALAHSRRFEPLSLPVEGSSVQRLARWSLASALDDDQQSWRGPGPSRHAIALVGAGSRALLRVPRSDSAATGRADRHRRTVRPLHPQ
jgi:hypothetical protein